MSKKPHLYFRNPVEGVERFKQKPRYGGSSEEEEENETMDYTPMRSDFIRSRNNYFADKLQKTERRNSQLDVPASIEMIEITFFNSFDSTYFDNRYRTNFGLSPVRFSVFNTVGLFAIIDEDTFSNFTDQIQLFIDTVDHSGNVEYNTDVKFIKEFKFLSRERIKNYQIYQNHTLLNLISNPEIFTAKIHPIEESLISYLNLKNVTYYVDLTNSKIEIVNQPEQFINELLDNFDIIHSANSFLAGVVGPNAFNMANVSYGFTIRNSEDPTLPIIGIIDTGISRQTPLDPIIINTNNDYDITGTSPVDDSADHGTSVGLLAALGKRVYPNHTGTFDTDAKLLSIKILGGKIGVLPQAEVLRLIRKARTELGVRIFTLTICYTTPKNDNSSVSEYARALDLLAYELDILIFISVGNNNNLTVHHGSRSVAVTYPDHFESSVVNLFAPAESMNNISVGSAAGNLENNDTDCISPDGEHPAIYTRKHHINWTHNSINQTRVNRQLLKPDVINYSGDYDVNLDPTIAGLKILTTQTGVFFMRHVGTSYSAPMSANLAAKLLKQYPGLINSMQTVKALIINSARTPTLGNTFDDSINYYPEQLVGRGIPVDNHCLFSDENSVTFVLEDTIKPEEIKAYPIKLPEYLKTVQRTNSLLQVDITLCFKFKPVANNHLAYCPIHITFGMFRDLPLQTRDIQGNLTTDGLNGNTMDNLKFKKSWAQDYYYKPKLLSNSQKLSFVISKKELLEENGSFKIALNAKYHKLLNSIDRAPYNIEHPFSLAISLRENPIKSVNTNQLYNEIIAINTTESFIIGTLEGEANAEAEG